MYEHVYIRKYMWMDGWVDGWMEQTRENTLHPCTDLEVLCADPPQMHLSARNRSDSC